MKRLFRKRGGRKVNKGGPSGLMISLIFHAVAFFVAGLFVVFTVLPPKEPVFEPPPPVERPKMKLKKPKVKIKKASSPKPAARIVANVKMAKMPEIAIPDLIGTGEGLLGGLGGTGTRVMGAIAEAGTIPTAFGGAISTGYDMVVTFYVLARNRDGSKNLKMAHQQYYALLRDFVADGWDPRAFSKYYRSPRKLYASCIAIPFMTSMVGPISFGEEDYVENCRLWVAHYKATLMSRDGITFRFWGNADDVLTVALNKEVVFAANFFWTNVDAWTIASEWKGATAPGTRSLTEAWDGSYYLGPNTMRGSEWITLEPGEEYEFDAIAGEGPGGEFFAVLLVEVQGEEYPKNDFGQPIFPLFATEPLTWEMQDAILMNLREGAANVTNINTYFIDQ